MEYSQEFGGYIEISNPPETQVGWIDGDTELMGEPIAGIDYSIYI